MAAELRAQTALLIKFLLEREDADHEIKRLGHGFDAPLLPGPNLRTDVVEELAHVTPRPQFLGHAQVESRIIHENHRRRPLAHDLTQCHLKSRLEVGVHFQHLPKANNTGGLNPVRDPLPRSMLHARPAQTGKTNRRIQHQQLANQARGMGVPTDFTGDDVEMHVVKILRRWRLLRCFALAEKTVRDNCQLAAAIAKFRISQPAQHSSRFDP